MNLNNQYLKASVEYLSLFEGETLSPSVVDGINTYSFKCPFCSFHTLSETYRNRKCAVLKEIEDDRWIFKCSRNGSDECKRGYRSFHNFLAMPHPSLHEDYVIAMSSLDSRNLESLIQYKKAGCTNIRSRSEED